MTVHITALTIYPIKSCAGIALNEAEITPAGLRWDREWVVVDHHGRFMTQRKWPRMVLIQPAIDGDMLYLTAPGMPVLALPLHTAARSEVPVTIWDEATLGADEGDAAADWLSLYMGVPCRLLRLHPRAARGIYLPHVSAWAEKNTEDASLLQTSHFGFADGFPFLMCFEESLHELNQSINQQGGKAVLMNRFRPNIVLQGLAAYEEDYLTQLSGSGHYFAKLKDCTRCPMPNVEPTDATVGEQPGQALASTRLFTQGTVFGINVALYRPSDAPTIRVGQALGIEYDL